MSKRAARSKVSEPAAVLLPRCEHRQMTAVVLGGRLVMIDSVVHVSAWLDSLEQ